MESQFRIIQRIASRGQLRYAFASAISMKSPQDECACSPVALEGCISLEDQQGTDAFQSLMLDAKNLARNVVLRVREDGGYFAG